MEHLDISHHMTKT